MIAEIPVDIDREGARAAAERELARPLYHADDPSWVERVGEWIVDRLGDLLDGAARVSPGGYGGLVVLLALLVLAAVVIRLRIGPVQRTAGGGTALFDATPRSAADHRRAADAHAAAGAWAEALRERLRAIVRDLEERDVLDTRPGRTALEAARDAGDALPGCAAELHEAALLFDDVWYGGRPATAAMDARLRAVDEVVRRARPAAPS